MSQASTVTPGELTVIGAAGGAIEVTIMQPLVSIKNALQEGRTVPTKIGHLYRGLAMNIVSMAPITASQFGANRFLTSVVLKKEEKDMNISERFFSASMAGAFSALIASPSELIIIQQQKSGRALAEETSHILRTYGLSKVTRGLLPCMGREAIYACGYLGIMPILQAMLTKQGLSPETSLLIGGVTGGVFASVCSHPFDTTKTRMQAFITERPEYRSMSSTVQALREEGGSSIFFKGLVPRMSRIVAATFILSYVRNTCIETIDESRRTKDV
uniref:Mitochondrial carrier protein n=1 Tax=Polytomella parva TaxID=51329 RepID=A0A7S0YRZ3_9CHLO|mmetsp:Transcript_9859/g.18404  ORF Transcript_9859/g.18404 Transcript_9859/m.18404 type:complete len:273 (+) Transcript_9859:71-889(+)